MLSLCSAPCRWQRSTMRTPTICCCISTAGLEGTRSVPSFASGVHAFVTLFVCVCPNSSNSKLYDPALHRMVHKMMTKVYRQLVARYCCFFVVRVRVGFSLSGLSVCVQVAFVGLCCGVRVLQPH